MSYQCWEFALVRVFTELKSHCEKYESDPLIYALARSCGCTSLDETALRAATAGHCRRISEVMVCNATHIVTSRD